MKKFYYSLIAFTTLSALTGCNSASESKTQTQETAAVVTLQAEQATHSATELAKVLTMQPAENQARYPARHPQQVFEFFGIKPGMTVIEALPGGGWYSKILLPYLGSGGHLIGADYAADMFPKFGFFSEEQIEAKKTWIETWTAEAEAWRDDKSASLSAYQMNSMPKDLDGTADAVVFIRALHNLARFDNDGEYLTKSLAEAFRALKSGGIVGVVQHLAPDDASDEWVNGSKGYLKKAFVIKNMQDAGFEYVDSSDVNLNPADMPGSDDIVWRLPPSFATSSDNPELKAKYMAIGESTRMTLKFRKP
jgi:predicted methyltransferase